MSSVRWSGQQRDAGRPPSRRRRRVRLEGGAGLAGDEVLDVVSGERTRHRVSNTPLVDWLDDLAEVLPSTASIGATQFPSAGGDILAKTIPASPRPVDHPRLEDELEIGRPDGGQRSAGPAKRSEGLSRRPGDRPQPTHTCFRRTQSHRRRRR